MDRRTFLAGTGAVLLAAPVTAEAQPGGNVYRIGHLQTAPRTQTEHMLKALGSVFGLEILGQEASAPVGPHDKRPEGAVRPVLEVHRKDGGEKTTAEGGLHVSRLLDNLRSLPEGLVVLDGIAPRSVTEFPADLVDDLAVHRLSFAHFERAYDGR